MNNKSKIENIKKRINNLQKAEESNDDKLKRNSGLSFGFRIGIEIVAAIVVGTVIGIFISKIL